MKNFNEGVSTIMEGYDKPLKENFVKAKDFNNRFSNGLKVIGFYNHTAKYRSGCILGTDENGYIYGVNCSAFVVDELVLDMKEGGQNIEQYTANEYLSKFEERDGANGKYFVPKFEKRG